MNVYKDYITFLILNQEVNLIYDEMCYGQNIIAEIDNQYYYLGNELPTITTAVNAWQELNNKLLTSEELHQIMVDNNLISAEI